MIRIRAKIHDGGVDMFVVSNSRILPPMPIDGYEWNNITADSLQEVVSRLNKPCTVVIEVCGICFPHGREDITAFVRQYPIIFNALDIPIELELSSAAR